MGLWADWWADLPQALGELWSCTSGLFWNKQLHLLTARSQNARKASAWVSDASSGLPQLRTGSYHFHLCSVGQHESMATLNIRGSGK